MKTNALRNSLLLAGLVAVGGVATAQTPAPVVPAGEASTMIRGKPNAQVKPDANSGTSRAAVKAEGTMAARDPANSTTGKGEASTTGPYGQPNVEPSTTATSRSTAMTPQERRAKRDDEVAMDRQNKKIKNGNPAIGTPQ
ncbi:hypothetical protein ACO2Q9_14735 [Variovorax sp. VNK109]|jgi:hypothetical protein|uniref:hypothetical protein n=1 Tax=Variovorax sp. VNK109 TaxID=3400919 RepID=UPI003C11E920